MEQTKYYAELGVKDEGENWGSCVHYNLDLMGKSVDIIDAVVWILLLLNLILDILSYKYRYLAQYCIYFQTANYSLTRMVPNT